MPVSREKVTVAAGTFDCFVIDGEGYAYSQRGFKIRLGLKRWMAPERVRRPIVSETFRKIERRLASGGRGARFSRGQSEGQVLQNERRLNTPSWLVWMCISDCSVMASSFGP